MHNYFSWILLTVILSIDYTNAVPLSGFYSFGPSNDDQQFSGLHRAASFAISISPSIPYFNETYSDIYVSSVSIHFLTVCFKLFKLEKFSWFS